MVGNGDKQRVLEQLLHRDEVTRAIVFTRTKHGANRVARKLENAGIVAEAIHGNKSQNARQRALQNFKDGNAWVLVATDIAARGIDIDGVSHVINYELPHEPESYVHRIGRTGRAGATGVAYSLVDPSERSRLRAVERLIKQTPVEVVVNLTPRDPTEIAAIEARRENHPAASSRNRSDYSNRSGEQRSSNSGRSFKDRAAGGRRRTRRKRGQRAA